ncbi:MAG TPA: hypothetical protein EYN66_00975 [Myxococcales bacterium]|nr:hypothetical protein [Myxococcales bacterium]
MKKTSVLMLLCVAFLFVGCGGNDMEATIDGTENSFDEVDIALKADGTLYKLTATGTTGDPAKDGGSRVTLNMDLDKAFLDKLEAGKEYAINGKSTFPDADAAAAPVYAPNEDQVNAVRRIWVEYACADCKAAGKESQRIEGNVTFDDITDEQLTGTLDVTVKGGIPGWKNADAEADIAVTFDVEIK